MQSLYEYDSYKLFLKDYLKSLPLHGHGEKSRIAQALKCQSAYFSQVLNGSADLSLEQADRLSTYLGQNDDEAEFLLLLIEFGRSGSKSLTDRLKKRIKKIRDHRVTLKNRLEYKGTLSLEFQTEFYRTPLNSIVHLMISIPELQSREALLKTLKIEPGELNRTLDFLARCGMIEIKGTRLVTGEVSLHLANDSKLIKQFHTNWRLRAIDSMTYEKEQDLHYSSLVSVAEADIPRIREIMAKAIEQIRSAVKNSTPEDAIYSYAMDLFQLYRFPKKTA